jgi:hypothetical protein
LPSSWKEADVEIRHGRIEGGSFIALRHIPTGVCVQDGPLAGRKIEDVKSALLLKLIDKVNAKRSLKTQKKKAKSGEGRRG